MTFRKLFLLLGTVLFWFQMTTPPAMAMEKITLAAASDLTFALNEIVTLYKKNHLGVQVETIYGSSGKIYTQIQQGAPYDLYFSADIAYPRDLKAKGMAGSDVYRYALGRIVLWSSSRNASKMTLKDLLVPGIQKIAIANPKHAPYGKRAVESLKAAGVWPKVESKLVYGENVSQAAQFVQSGNAQVGIIALSLALNPQLAKHGNYALIPNNLHQPLEQGFVVTKRAAKNPTAHNFATFMLSKEAKTILTHYGFVLPPK